MSESAVEPAETAETKTSVKMCWYGTKCPMYQLVAIGVSEFVDPHVIEHVNMFTHGESNACVYGDRCSRWKRVRVAGANPNILDFIHCSHSSHGGIIFSFVPLLDQLMEAMEEMLGYRVKTHTVSACSRGSNCAFWKKNYRGNKDPLTILHMRQCTHAIIPCNIVNCQKRGGIHSVRYSHFGRQ